MDETNIAQMIAGAVSGGASAFASFAAVFKKIKQRIADIEAKLGSDNHPRTGLFLIIDRFEASLNEIKVDIKSWQDEPPTWLIRTIRRAVSSGAINREDFEQLERLIEQRHRTTAASIARLEDQLNALKTSYVSRADYERDARKRVEELAKVREQLATSNGLLRGVMSALGYIDPEKKTPPT